MCLHHTGLAGAVKVWTHYESRYFLVVVLTIFSSSNSKASASIHLHKFFAGRPFVHSMADPLSVTASVIAVVTAAEDFSETLVKIKNARNAPCEFLALVNEVSDLRIALNDVESNSEDAPGDRSH